MIINLSPLFEAHIHAVVRGDVVIMNGVSFDFSPLPLEGILPRHAINSDYFGGDVYRHANGEIELTLRSPASPESSEAAMFPKPIYIQEGTVEFPK